MFIFFSLPYLIRFSTSARSNPDRQVGINIHCASNLCSTREVRGRRRRKQGMDKQRLCLYKCSCRPYENLRVGTLDRQTLEKYRFFSWKTSDFSDSTPRCPAPPSPPQSSSPKEGSLVNDELCSPPCGPVSSTKCQGQGKGPEGSSMENWGSCTNQSKSPRPVTWVT